MVKLRLKRMGRKHEPHYRIVATDSRSPRDGRFIEELGWFNPKAKEVLYKLNIEGIKKWLSNGAQPSYAVKSILIKEGIVESCLLYTSPSPRDRQKSRMPSSA